MLRRPGCPNKTPAKRQRVDRQLPLGLLGLPSEVLVQTGIQYLDLASVWKLATCCKALRAVVDCEFLARHFWEHHFPDWPLGNPRPMRLASVLGCFPAAEFQGPWLLEQIRIWERLAIIVTALLDPPDDKQGGVRIADIDPHGFTAEDMRNCGRHALLVGYIYSTYSEDTFLAGDPDTHRPPQTTVYKTLAGHFRPHFIQPLWDTSIPILQQLLEISIST